MKKLVILALTLAFSLSTFAADHSTNCSEMNGETREVIKKQEDTGSSSSTTAPSVDG